MVLSSEVSSPQLWVQNYAWGFFIFFACPKKTKQKKRHFFQGIFALTGQNRSFFAEFFPRLQKFLTPKNCYTAKKDFLVLLLILKLLENSINYDALPFSTTQSLFDFSINFALPLLPLSIQQPHTNYTYGTCNNRRNIISIQAISGKK